MLKALQSVCTQGVPKRASAYLIDAEGQRCDSFSVVAFFRVAPRASRIIALPVGDSCGACYVRFRIP